MYTDKLIYVKSYFVSCILLGNRDTMMVYTDMTSGSLRWAGRVDRLGEGVVVRKLAKEAEF